MTELAGEEQTPENSADTEEPEESEAPAEEPAEAAEEPAAEEPVTEEASVSASTEAAITAAAAVPTLQDGVSPTAEATLLAGAPYSITELNAGKVFWNNEKNRPLLAAESFYYRRSADGGKTWSVLWDAKKSLESYKDYVVSGRAFVTLPAELCVSNVIFAWHYTRPAGDNSGIAAIDNIKLEATGVSTDVEGKAKITATAGEGGIITPSGRIYVTEGEDQTFTITPITGFAIADVLVDGFSVGTVSSYTFTKVTGTHTIDASFKVSSSEPGVLFENDFEDSSFPSRGWSVKSLGSGHNTWSQGSFSNVSSTKVALVVNEYEDWSNAPRQNELLISPKVDLTGISPILEFDYAFGRYDLFNGTISLTLEVSTDSGETWTKLWDASTLTKNDTGLYQSGHAAVEIPAFYCKDGISFAFRYSKLNGYEGEKAGIDNVKLTNPSALCEHPTTEVRNARNATCTEDGYTGDTYCISCGALLAAGNVIPAAGHSLEKTEAKDASCTEPGNTAYWTCSVCGKLFSDEKGEHEITLEATVIPAKGHDWGEWVVTVRPTCTAEGKQVRTCSACGETETEVLPKLACPSANMTDVPETAWYHDAVDYMMAKSLMGGVSATTFDPEGTLTRAQLVTVLYRIEGEPEVDGKHQFTDVPAGQWYSDAICWAAQNGIVNGVSKTEFAPEEPVTREQIAAILYRYTKSEPVKENKLSAFPDAGKVSPYAVEALNWAVSEGLINGSDGRLMPNDTATRAQIATVLMRWLESNG